MIIIYLTTFIEKNKITKKIVKYFYKKRFKSLNLTAYQNAPEYIRNDFEIIKDLCNNAIVENNSTSYELLNSIPIQLLYQYMIQYNTVTEIFKMLTDDNKKKLIHNTDILNTFYKEILSDIDENEQELFLKHYPERTQYASKHLQLNLLTQNSRTKYSKFVSEDIAREFISINPALNFRLVSIELQKKMVEENSKFLEYAHIDLFKDFINDSNFIESLFISQPYIINKIRHLFSPQIIHNIVLGTNLTPIMDATQITASFLHSKLFSAKGTLVTDSQTPSGLFGYNNTTHSNSYSWEDGNLIAQLPISQFLQLLQIDSNYILPRLSTMLLETEETANQPYFVNRNFEDSLLDCKQIFKALYGNEKLTQFSKIIDSIYNIQKNYSKQVITHENISKIPLQQLKILFNPQIINNNNFQLLNDYFTQVFNNQESQENFVMLIENAYGKKAADIIRNRNFLDVNEINSLEIFDSRIINNFSLSFVNDLISYNIEEFSGFLEIIKNPQKLECFKIYYQLLTSIMGENVEVMQKAIIEYDIIEPIIQEFQNGHISTQQYAELYSFLCSKIDTKFKIAIKNVKDLNNYNECMNRILIDDVALEAMSGTPDIDCIKRIIVTNIFGIDFSDFSPFVSNISITENSLFNNEEISIIKCLKYIKEETDLNKLVQYVQEIIQQKNIRDPHLVYTVLHKIRENSLEIINNRLLTKDKMDKKIAEFNNGEEFNNKEELPIYVEEINGIRYYHLNGIEFDIIASGAFLSGKLSLNKILNYEGQSGTSSISARYIRSDNAEALRAYLKLLTADDKYKNWYVYTNLNEEDFIAIHDCDAGVIHDNKVVKSKGIVGNKIEVPKTMKNEVAFYRRHRNHQHRKSENLGGKNIPDFWMGEVNNEVEELLRKHNISVLVIHADKYLERQQEYETFDLSKS